MRLFRTTIAAAAIALLAAVGTVAPAASAAPNAPQNTAELIGVVQQTGAKTAEVTVRYTCDITEPWLWVSVKQSADRTADPRLTQPDSGGNRVAAAWSQSHDTSKLNCDGKSHVAKFTVDQAKQGYGKLGKGEAWVQFCLIGENAFVSESEFLHLR
jgi:hypothetical protein